MKQIIGPNIPGRSCVRDANSSPPHKDEKEDTGSSSPINAALSQEHYELGNWICF